MKINFFILNTVLAPSLVLFLNIRLFLTFNFTFENKDRNIFCEAKRFFSYTKMRVSEQGVVLSDCLRKFPCLYDRQTSEYHQINVTENCWKEVANKAG